MEDNRLLFDAFDIYYERGIAALQKNEYTVARRNILAAAETLLKIAKDSVGAVKAQRLKRATELYELANKIEQKQRAAMDSTASDSAARDAAKFGVTPGSGSGSGKGGKDEGLTEFLPAQKTGITLDDVAGLKEAKDEIRSSLLSILWFSLTIFFISSSIFFKMSGEKVTSESKS